MKIDMLWHVHVQSIFFDSQFATSVSLARGKPCALSRTKLLFLCSCDIRSLWTKPGVDLADLVLVSFGITPGEKTWPMLNLTPHPCKHRMTKKGPISPASSLSSLPSADRTSSASLWNLKVETRHAVHNVNSSSETSETSLHTSAYHCAIPAWISWAKSTWQRTATAATAKSKLDTESKPPCCLW